VQLNKTHQGRAWMKPTRIQLTTKEKEKEQENEKKTRRLQTKERKMVVQQAPIAIKHQQQRESPQDCGRGT
jgi:hypothetical protein